MQNRNMFLYRRQGPKKRPKSGTPRKGRNPQKGLPNSARDLLPIIQPATKALAQMLAGRTAASGQLGHARAVLAQTEKLVADRAHNRLNPTEREEFFEQVARLKLTLSDAESEAEFQAAEEQAPMPAPVPVDRERLKAMAMSLTSSAAKSAGTSDASENNSTFASHSNGSPTALNEAPASDVMTTTPKHEPPLSTNDDGKTQEEQATKQPSDPNQLRLPRDTTDKLVLQSAAVSNVDGTIRRRKPKLSTSPKSKMPSKPVVKSEAEALEENDSGDNVQTAKPKTLSSTKATHGQKLPKGWIIDDEGFVVPGPS